MYTWKEFIREVDSLSSRVSVLFFFHPKDKRELIYLLKRDGITTPVCFDMEDQLNALNRFPPRDDFQCFLLDENNRVVCIGNPVHNPRIKEMYLSEIASNVQTETSQLQNTTVRAEQTLYNLGTLKRGEAAIVTARIHNTGNAPLAVHEIEVSCDCTTVEYKKRMVSPGAAFEMEITYNAEDRGFFDRIIYIYANTEVSPITIRLEGEVM